MAKKPTVPYSVPLGLYLKKLRIVNDMTQLEVAKKCDLNVQMVSNWERGIAGPSFEILVKLTKIYRIPENEILNKLRDAQMELFKKEFHRLKNKV